MGNMNVGSLHTRSFSHIHLFVLGTALQVGLTSDLEGTGMEMNNSRYDSRTCTCVLKGRKSRELEMFLFCLWNKFAVSIMCLSIFYFSAYKTELELKLLENRVQILGKCTVIDKIVSPRSVIDDCKPAHFFTNSLSARVYKFIACKLQQFVRVIP